MVGSSVGGYRILEKIRDGGAGTVFKAQGPKGEIVAIKMISEAWNEQRDRRKAFKRESDTTQKLVHPTVIRVFAYCDGPPRPYIVLEYFPSENLKFTLWHKQQVLEGRRMPVLKQCAEALYYIHTQGVVHRDVKPENFLVNAEGSVRLIDFSIAQTKWDRFLFSFGKKVDGTPLYMAPEQIRNESQDQRADMYSYGVMVFELMTRRPPFIGASVDSILEKHLKAAPPSMRSIVQDVSPELDELVTRLLSKKAADRPSDMSLVIAVLNRLVKKEEEARLRDSRGPSRVVAAVGTAGTTQVPGTRAVGSRPTPSTVPAVPGGTRQTPSAVPAVGSAGTKPPSSTALPPVAAATPKPPSSTALPPVTPATPEPPISTALPPVAAATPKPPSSTALTPTKPAGAPEPAPAEATTTAGAPGGTRTQTKVRVPAAQGTTRTQTKAGVPPAQSVTRTQTKSRPPGSAAAAAPAPALTGAPPATAPVPPQAPKSEAPPPPVPAAATAGGAAAPPATSPAAGPVTAPAAKEAAEATSKPATDEDAPRVEPTPEPPKGNE